MSARRKLPGKPTSHSFSHISSLTLLPKWNCDMSCAANANHKFNNWTSFTALEQQQKLQAYQKKQIHQRKVITEFCLYLTKRQLPKCMANMNLGDLGLKWNISLSLCLYHLLCGKDLRLWSNLSMRKPNQSMNWTSQFTRRNQSQKSPSMTSKVNDSKMSLWVRDERVSTVTLRGAIFFRLVRWSFTLSAKLKICTFERHLQEEQNQKPL